jgi:hypothetical protein
VPGDQRALAVRLRAVVEAKDIELAALWADVEAERELIRRLSCGSRSWNGGWGKTGPIRLRRRRGKPIGANETRRARQQSERERRKDRMRGGQPGHAGKGPSRDPDPSWTKAADPPAECRRCRAGLDGADAVEPRWTQVIDVEAVRAVTEWLLLGLACPYCGTVTFAEPPPGAVQERCATGLCSMPPPAPRPCSPPSGPGRSARSWGSPIPGPSQPPGRWQRRIRLVRRDRPGPPPGIPVRHRPALRLVRLGGITWSSIST